MSRPAISWLAGLLAVLLTIGFLAWLDKTPAPRVEPEMTRVLEPSAPSKVAESSLPPVVTFSLPVSQPAPVAEPVAAVPVETAPRRAVPSSPARETKPKAIPRANSKTQPAATPPLPAPSSASRRLIVREKQRLGGRQFINSRILDAQGRPVYWQEPVYYYLVCQDGDTLSGPHFIYRVSEADYSQTAVGVYHPIATVRQRWQLVPAIKPPERPPNFRS